MSLRTIEMDAGGDAAALALVLCKLGVDELILTPADAEVLVQLRRNPGLVLVLGANLATREMTLRFVERADLPAATDTLQ